MKTPESLSTAFGPAFEEWITEFLVAQKLIEEPTVLKSSRFLARSIAIFSISALFSRLFVGLSCRFYWGKCVGASS